MSDGTESAPAEPIWRGVTVVGGEIQVTPSISVGDDLVPVFSATARVRTDMWPFWLEEAVDAAKAVCHITEPIPELDAALQVTAAGGEPNLEVEQRLIRLLYGELRASMRAVSACAFAIDAFYATVKERCGPHPHADTWRRNRTARVSQIVETFRHHLRPEGSRMRSINTTVTELFDLRDMAVHMAADWHDPVPRSDIHTSLDRRFSAFRRDNAVIAVGNSVHLFDYFVSVLARGGKELAKLRPIANERMCDVWQLYEQVSGLPELPRLSNAGQEQ